MLCWSSDINRSNQSQMSQIQDQDLWISRYFGGQGTLNNYSLL